MKAPREWLEVRCECVEPGRECLAPALEWLEYARESLELSGECLEQACPRDAPPCECLEVGAELPAGCRDQDMNILERREK